MAKSKAPAAAAAKHGNGDNKPIRNLYLADGSGYLFRACHALPPVNRLDGSAWPPPCPSTAPILPRLHAPPSRRFDSDRGIFTWFNNGPLYGRGSRIGRRKYRKCR